MLQMPKRSLCDLVLDTIDIISARKNRPNLVRIYRHLHRLYDLSLSTCEALLQSLLKEGRVIRVTYKGNISYRNALKWKKYSYYMKKTMGSELPGTILTKAISELVVQEPDYLNMGVPCKILEEHLLSMSDDNINKETIHKLLQRELKHESLLQLDNGNYFLGPKPPESSLFDGEEVDFKFHKVKKVKTYKHEIKRLKDKAIDPINPSSLISRNNNGLESDKELPDSEELKQSDVTDIKQINNGESGELNEFDKTCNNDTNPSLILEDSNCNSKIIKAEENSNHEDSEANADKNGTVNVNEKVEPNESAIKLDEENKNSKLRIRGLEELVDPESGCSQAMDSDESGSSCFNPNNNTCSIEKVSPSSTIDEEKFQESSEDSFSLNIANGDVTMNSSLEKTLPSDHNSKKDESLTNEGECAISPSDEVTKEGNDDSRSKGFPLKIDSSSGKTSNCTSGGKGRRKAKKFQPVERVQRKKRTKYDASDYYFPSLKRKTRDSTSDNDKKDDKRRKKKKKDNGGGCLSGIFAKRVMFPGNTSMCCECNCYISKVKLDPMVFCSTCATQGHQSCALKTMNGKNWFCVGCRAEAMLPKCTICSKSADKDDKGVLHSCSRCGDKYHKDCHKLTIKVPLSDEWFCFKCSLELDSSKEINGSPVKSDGKPDDEIQNSVFQNENKSNNTYQFLKEEPPDYRNWSAEEVYNYFKEYLDEEVAKAFMEQDIDGYALKLMGRSDVLNLGLKLGPSMKVLFHVRRLQLCSNNLMEIWSN